MIYADEPLANRLPQDWREWIELLPGHMFPVTRRPTRCGAMERRSLIPRCVFLSPLAYRTDRIGD